MYEESPSDCRTPNVDFVALLQQRLAQKAVTAEQTIRSENSFDPYQMMMDRRNQNVEQLPSIQSYPQEDIDKLQEFCAKHGILGFNCGRMSPSAALMFLKQKMGIVDVPQPSESRGPNYPFTQPIRKRQLLMD